IRRLAGKSLTRIPTWSTTSLTTGRTVATRRTGSFRSRRRSSRMIVHHRIEGSKLAGNLLGDPSERDLFVYLPPGYEESDRRYPTAYLLHAYGDTAELLVTPATDGERWRPPLEDVLDPVFGRMGWHR